MRALTVRQPWAHAIAHLGKRIENRGWRTAYRGELAIHAGINLADDAAFVAVARIAREAGRKFAPLTLPTGVVAVANLVDAHLAFRVPVEPGVDDGSFRVCCLSPWAQFGDGPVWHWWLDDVRPLPEPVRCRGAQGLWTLPDDVEDQVRAQLAEVAE